MNILIETPRLRIRPLQESDKAAMFDMDSDPEVHRYLGNTPVMELSQSEQYIVSIRQQYADHGIGRWAVEERESGAFVGWTGFKYITDTINGHSGHYDFGYRQLRRFWGKGYGFEAAKAALDHGIARFGFREVYGMTDVANKGSRRILEKLGFEFVEIFAFDAPQTWPAFHGQPTTWYRLPKAIVDVLASSTAST